MTQSQAERLVARLSVGQPVELVLDGETYRTFVAEIRLRDLSNEYDEFYMVDVRYQALSPADKDVVLSMDGLTRVDLYHNCLRDPLQEDGRGRFLSNGVFRVRW